MLGPNAALSNIWCGNPALGAERAYGSLAWARRSGNKRLAAFAAAIAARAHARLGEADLCRRMLDESESELNRHVADDSDPDWLSVFDESGPVRHRGWCLLDLGEPRAAIAVMEDGIAASPQLFVRNGILCRLASAEAHLKLGEIETGCAAIEEALDYAEPGAVTPRVIRMFHAASLRLRSSPSIPDVAATWDRLRSFIVANE